MDIMSEAKQLLETKGVETVASQLRQRGLDKQVSSWISTGESMPVVGSQIKTRPRISSRKPCRRRSTTRRRTASSRLPRRT
jgi:hypothetical protein